MWWINSATDFVDDSVDVVGCYVDDDEVDVVGSDADDTAVCAVAS